MPNYCDYTMRIHGTKENLDTFKKSFKANSVIATTTHLSDWIGSLNTTVAQPREIIQFALLSNAARLILSHNHPSGNTAPSKSDSKFTDRMTHACDLIGIDLLDHIIVSDDPINYYSFKENHHI